MRHVVLPVHFYFSALSFCPAHLAILMAAKFEETALKAYA